jgi:hypothetical protein
VDYRIVNGAGVSANPDTLRFYISYYNVYDENVEKSGYFAGTFSSGGRTLIPYINYADPFQDKGPYATTPQAPNRSTIIRDHILSDEDSVSAGLDKNWIGWRPIELPLLTDREEGFEIPAGACLGVVVKYIPGYDYPDFNSIGKDTITVTTWNTTDIGDDGQFVSKQIYNNFFGIANWNYDTAKVNYMFDQTGYNGSLHETQNLRYKDTTKWGLFTYHGGYYGKPVFYMGLSVTEDDTVHIPIDGTGITEVADLISGIYPNPATTHLTIDLANAGNADVIVYNMLGESVLQETLTNTSNRINIATLSPGMYVVKVKQNGQMHTVKMSKK